MTAKLSHTPNKIPILGQNVANYSVRGSRDKLQESRRWYFTQAWKRLRWFVLSRDLFTCLHCKRIWHDTSNLIAHHIVAHRGDRALFWDPSNLTTVCKPCHDSFYQSQERNVRQF